MQRYLPGSTFVVRNLPGAGHLVGTNTIFASRADGLTIGTFNTGLIYNQLVGLPGMKFDLTKMSWIGKATTEPRAFVIAQQSPIKTFADLQSSKEPVNFATSGVGSANYVETTMLAIALKLPAKILTGYNGNDDQLAMRRGEVVGTIGSRSSFEQFVKNGYGRFVAQIGGKDTDVPQLRDLVKDPAALSLIALVQSQGDIARLTAGPPGIPQDAARRAARGLSQGARGQGAAGEGGEARTAGRARLRRRRAQRHRHRAQAAAGDGRAAVAGTEEEVAPVRRQPARAFRPDLGRDGAEISEYPEADAPRPTDGSAAEQGRS